MNIDKRIARLEKQLAEAKAEKERQEDPVIATIVITGGGYNTKVTLKDVSYSVSGLMDVEDDDGLTTIWNKGPQLSLWGKIVTMAEVVDE